MSRLILKNITKSFGDIHAVQHFDLETKDKQFIVLAGPSGCGKSTLLQLIAGFLSVDEGKAFIDDIDVTDKKPSERNISMAFQEPSLFPHMSVYENIAFGFREEINDKGKHARVEQISEMLGIKDLLDRKAVHLSGGQKQRCAIARALISKPSLFLMDEPLSNLDAKLRVQMRVEILKIYQQLGTTFIYVTHDQTEAMTMGTRIVVMKDGRIQQVAAPTFLYEHPINKFVAGFIGSPQMNFRDGKIVEREGKMYIELSDISLEIPEDKGTILKEKGYIGKVVTMGIRPEDISTHPHYIMSHPESSFQSEIDVVELMGAESYIHMTKDNQPFVVKVSGSTALRTGDQGSFTYLMNKAHFFDKESELNILENGEKES